MKKIEEIITRRYYNEIFSALKEFVIINHQQISVSKCNLYDINFLKLDDFEIRRLLSTKRMGSKLRTILQVIAFVDASGQSYYGYETDSGEVWLHVSIEYKLDDGIKEFSVESITIAEKDNVPKSDFTSDFVPIISSNNFDEIASLILQDYQPNMLQSPKALDLPLFLKSVGLSLVEAKLSLNQSILGEITFQDSSIEVFDDSDSSKMLDVKKGTIVVDSNIRDFRNQGCYNNTVVHEVVHWLLHKNYQEVRMLTESEYNFTYTDSYNIETNHWNPNNWMEWHANSLAPRILMPKKTTKEKVNQLFTRYSLSYTNYQKTSMFEQIIDDIANFFKVSRLAAKIRLQQLGYHEFEGIYNFVGDKYLRSYSSELNAMATSQTFTISFSNACLLNWKNDKFRELMDSNRYVYVDSHFCLKHSKYVNMVEFGVYEMTDYAYQHMNECCLHFDISYKNDKEKPISITTFNEYIMYRGRATTEVQVDFSDYMEVFGNAVIVKDSKVFEEVTKVIEDMPNGFCNMLVYHRERKQITQELLEELSGVSVSTIQRLETDNRASRKLEKLVAIVLGMKLYPDFSFKLIDKSGTNFRDEVPAHCTYKMLLRNYYHLGAYECNQKLIEMNLPGFFNK